MAPTALPFPARLFRAPRLTAAALFCALLATAAPASTDLPRRPEVKPRSIVFILTDDHRYDAMGFLGHPFLETPHLDSIARNGAHFANAMVTTSLCSPSRASILSGLYTHKHRVIDNNRPLPPGTVTFPEYLQAAGYATAYIGKWHMGGESDAPRPGFDRWVSFRGQGSYLPERNGLNIDGARVPQKGYITDELTDYALEWLRTRKAGEKPFFLYLSHKGVHANFTPAERHAGRYRDAPWSPPTPPADASGTPRWVRDQRNSWHGVDFPYHSDLDIAAYYRNYCETLLAVDDSVGRVLGALREMGVLDETLVVYMGDNGFMFGEHGLIDKRTAHDVSIRVPMLAQCPQLIPAGTVVDAVVANIDIAPTLLAAAGLVPPPHLDGTDMLPLTRGREVPWRDAFLYVYYWEKNFPQTPTQFALRTDRFKYITTHGTWDIDQLYDLSVDPGETRNLILDAAHAATVRGLEAQLYRMLDESGGMSLPLNPPAGGSRNLRLGPRDGSRAADFPPSMVVPEPVNRNAH